MATTDSTKTALNYMQRPQYDFAVFALAFKEESGLFSKLKQRKQVARLAADAVNGPLDAMAMGKVIERYKLSTSAMIAKGTFKAQIIKPGSLVNYEQAPGAVALTYSLGAHSFNPSIFGLLDEFLAIIQYIAEIKAKHEKLGILQLLSVGRMLIELIIKWKQLK